MKNRELIQGMLILFVGLLAGVLLPSLDTWFPETSSSGSEEAELLRHPLAPSDISAPPADNGLMNLRITISDEHALTLQRARDKALESLVSTGDTKMWLPAEVELNGQKAQARVRLKGDLDDHVRSDKWSLRIELLDAKIEGMRTFSIQTPNTRGYLWEWVVLQAARDEGLLAPHCNFVNVTLNNTPNGVYYLEEHTAKEFLEGQKRREGPIVRYTDNNYWETQLRNHVRTYTAPLATETIQVAFEPVRTTTQAFDEKRMSSIDALNRQLHAAIDKMKIYQSKLVLDREIDEYYTRLLALEESQGKILEDIFDMQQLAKAHSLLTLYQGGHALLWFNQRYYHNPVTERLEPIVHDTSAAQPYYLNGLAVEAPILKVFTRSHQYKHHYFMEVGKFGTAAYLEAFFARHNTQLRVYEEALRADNELPDQYQLDAMINRLRGRQIHLHQMLNPERAVNLKADLHDTENGKRVVVEAWTTTKVPAVIESFHFSNGVSLDAAEVLQHSRYTNSAVAGNTVVIQGSGDHTFFSFDVDERLQKLRDVSEIKQAIRSGGDADKSVKLDIKVRYRALTADQPTMGTLSIRRKIKEADPNKGRPKEPTLDELLAQHDFLSYDLTNHQLLITSGKHQVNGDIVIPSHIPLKIEAGTTLAFSKDAVLVTTGPLLSEGTEDNPIRLMPRKPDDKWGGIAVLSSPAVSRLIHTEVHQTAGIARGGWVLTGGVTFYRSPLFAEHALFDGNTAEDALNVISATITLRKVTIRNCPSDAFDGDFVSGSVVNSTFISCQGDGVDTSGSDITVSDCTFTDMGDKAISIGENSRAILNNNTVNGAMIAVAAKDKSEVTLDGLTFSGIRHYVLASYIKKLEYGPCVMHVSHLRGDYTPSQLLNQESCTMTVDGEVVPGQVIDVPRLYREKKLGN